MEPIRTLSKREIEDTSGFIKYNRKNNQYYKKGIDLIDYDFDDIPTEVAEFLKKLPIREYFNERDDLLDIYYNTYLNTIERDQKINQILNGTN